MTKNFVNRQLSIVNFPGFLKKRIYWISLCVVLVSAYYFSLPAKLFNDPYSTVLQSRDGALLSASIAEDGQWRFPQADSVPGKFAEALITFEDKRFYNHPGIDLLPLGRAFKQNIKAGKIVSGGSTITMQVVRLSRKIKSRTIWEKVIELILATRLDLKYSKAEILKLYASHAPFGGNVVGLDAACWRYFGTDAKDLSWAQVAMLAVLPNSPSLMHLGKNRDKLKTKRDRLLKKLRDTGVIDQLTFELALEEQVPEAPHALPENARHLLLRMSKDGFSGTRLTSTIDLNLQKHTERILEDHHQKLSGNQIYNNAALILDVKSGNVLAYVGNIGARGFHESEVDIIASQRSTGSILKPFLFSAMMDEGKILPSTLLQDTPLLINGFAPKNFTHAYDGAVHADQALIRSLNIPAVHLLRGYRYEKFQTLLTSMGMTTLHQPPDHYGLSLILGGAEATLWDITGMYASMARTLNNYFEYPGGNRYNREDFHAPHYFVKQDTVSTNHEPVQSSWLSASSIFITFEKLKELYRPGEESGWRYFNSSRKIAWKTGTSFGFRDGWAIGVTPDYVVGVWVGNADGEGRPGLTGTEAAAPILFDIFSQLPGQSWFAPPLGEMQEVNICRKSGHRATAICDEIEKVWISKTGISTKLCPYHKTVHLTRDLKFQVSDACASLSDMKHETWFVLPPIQELYFKGINLSYKSLPPLRPDCQLSGQVIGMDMVYPKNNARIFIPRELDGKPGSSVFELAHRNPNTTVFWHLDGMYIGSTKKIHNMALNPGEGKHILTAVDDEGQSIERHFVVISKM
jgi:penicillin-binding protein 1C